MGRMLACRGSAAHRAERPFLTTVSHPDRAGCTIAPIVGGLDGIDPCFMVQFAIRCHARLPVAADELEGWLGLEVDELRAAAPDATIRLLRLTPSGPDAELDAGWLVELELAEDEPLLAGNRLADALRDMRLLGLQPTLLAPRGASSNGRAA
jgi:hypothetical protein